MAYDTNEERLKVRGSEQITRDLKVNRDAYINGKLNANNIKLNGDLDVSGEVIARDDVSISGDLYVNGTEYINNSETSQTSDNYLVLRHNHSTALGTNEHSGLAVHNYTTGKTATLTTDKDGTWRIADNTETDTNYTNVSLYGGTYYTGLTNTTTTVASGIKTAFDTDELDECVFYNGSYYHWDNALWYQVSLVSNALTVSGTAVTDTATITALEALTKDDLVYFRSLTITVISEVENEPVLTRDEATNLTNNNLLAWDSTTEKAVNSGIAKGVTVNGHALTSNVTVTKSDVGLGDVENKPLDTTVTSGSSNYVTSGAVYTAIENEATARGTAITNSIEALDVSDTAVSGKYVSAVSETDGKITVTRGNLPTVDQTYDGTSTNAQSGVAVASAIGVKVPDAPSTNGDYQLQATVSSGSATYSWEQAVSPTDISCATALCRYVTINTAAETAAKTVDLEGFVLSPGARLVVYLANSNTALSATLNVNGTGTKDVYVTGIRANGSQWGRGYYNAYYDGTNWMLNKCSKYAADTARYATNADNANSATIARGVRTFVPARINNGDIWIG